MANGHVRGDRVTAEPNGGPGFHPGPVAESMEDTVEFKLVMAYAQRRRPGDPRLSTKPVLSTGGKEEESKTEEEEEEKKKKKKGKRGLLRFFSCVRSQGRVEDDTDITFRGNAPRDGGEVEEEEKKMEAVASRLTQIADQVPFSPPDIESDTEEDDVERLIGLLLRESGDKFEKELLKDKSLVQELFWKYSFFERLMTAFFRKMGIATPNARDLGPDASPKTQIALTCEVTNRLSAVDTHPMSRLMGFGARYLQERYSTWAAQQGGYEEAFIEEDDDDKEVQ